jgi:hypothetical protein
MIEGVFMKRMLFGFVLVAVLALASCVLPGKVEIFFNNCSSYPVDFYMNGNPLPANPVSSGSWTEWADLSAGEYYLSALVPNQYVAPIGSTYVIQNSVSTGSVILQSGEIFTFNVYNGLTWTGSITKY